MMLLTLVVRLVSSVAWIGYAHARLNFIFYSHIAVSNFVELAVPKCK